jgi:signal transduction histidine kinase
MSGYLRAFEKQIAFSLEYRLQRHDGAYRWVLDVGAPRLGADGEFAGYVGCALDISEQKLIEADLRQSQQRLRALAAKVQTVREEERTRIAREIHDQLAQALTRLKMDAGWIGTHAVLPAVAAQAQAMGEQIGQLQHTVRRIAAELRPALLDTAGLLEAVKWEADEFARRTGTECQVSLPAELVALAPERATALYRILQEILTNAAQHAAAKRVEIRIAALPDALHLVVLDDGRGFQPSAQPGGMLGILGMQERAVQYGGEFSIDANAPRGTRASVRMPYR